MTERTPTAIKVGDRLSGVEVLSLDQLGKRVLVRCECGNTHVFGAEALAAGQEFCPSRPNKKERA